MMNPSHWADSVAHQALGLMVLLVILSHLSARFSVRQGLGLLGIRGYSLSFGLIGTLVHELSHLLAAWVFLHRIGRVQLLNLDPNAPVRGFVEHAPRPMNPWCLLGTPIIALAPILVSAAGVAIVTRWAFASTGFADPLQSAWMLSHPLSLQAWSHLLVDYLQALMALRADPDLWLFSLSKLFEGTGCASEQNP